MPSIEGENQNQRTKSGLNNDKKLIIYIVDYQVVTPILVSKMLNRNELLTYSSQKYTHFLSILKTV